MANLINTEVKPFKATAFHNGEFIQISDADLKGKWSVVFFYPADFTFVCPTELGDLADNYAEFKKMGVEIYSVSTDTHFTHKAWHDTSDTIRKIQYPMIGDPELKVAKLYGMLPAESGDSSEGRTPMDNATVRNVFVIGPDKKIKLIIVYPMSTGRNFDEVLRVIDSLQLTATHKVATPVNWQNGDDCIIVPAVSDEEAKKAFPNGWKTLKPYLRVVKQPG